MGEELVALGALEVRVEHEARRIRRLEQHHANVGKAVFVHGRERHGGRIVDLRRRRILQPFAEQGERFAVGREVTTR